MLEDFVRVNSLKARVLHFHKSNEHSAVCELYFPKTGPPFLVVKLLHAKINPEKLQKVITEGYLVATEEKCSSITGYSLKYLPPISVYGVILLLDKEAAQHDLLFFATAEEQTLEIAPSEILESNEDSKIVDII